MIQNESHQFKYWLLIYLWNIKLNNGLSITMVLFFTFISHVQALLTLIKKNPKRFFPEKKEIFCYGICLSPSNPSTVIYTHTDSFHAFKWILCVAVNICRHWFTAVSLTCLLTFCGISSCSAALTSNNGSLYADWC